MIELVNSYVDWIKKGISLREVGDGWHEMITPFLNHKNDMIEIYLRKESDGSISISDAGVTLSELKLSGIDIDRSEKRAKELDIILRSFGILRTENNELIAKTTTKNFPQVKHRVIQAILSIDDLFVLAKPKVESFFIEDVITFFELRDVIYVRDTTFIGKSGFSHKFDFTLPKIKQRKEVAIKAINTPRKDRIESVMWMLEDTRLVRPETEGLLILNDENEISSEVQRALEEYNIKYFEWSKREDNIPNLVA
ncbi:DUF1828 domain-containing protein [Fulvivirga sediminis]|uniref:DUF1828 domain-containing protein n=1 Tax=Fulvivirga sediminis TaxID=2803949 RepID=A0A937F4X8_9BACT|nr:DUF1828 domain-containing protein [Fulvivirga sediminis]MBL3655081.1 DUF1828 domain-containing protein [Fulvivirga sediminis]